MSIDDGFFSSQVVTCSRCLVPSGEKQKQDAVSLKEKRGGTCLSYCFKFRGRGLGPPSFSMPWVPRVPACLLWANQNGCLKKNPVYIYIYLYINISISGMRSFIGRSLLKADFCGCRTGTRGVLFFFPLSIVLQRRSNGLAHSRP